MLLYQNGGEFYEPDGRRTAIDSDVGINSFKQMTKFYTDYGLELAFDLPNRFRTGEMPLGIVDYTVYNNLQVFAPEIKGLWGFALVPGTPREGGRLDRSVTLGGQCIAIMEQSADKGASWEFLKWWTSAEVQTRYGRGLESIMGSAARYPTANLEAFRNLPWPVEDYNIIYEQMTYARGVPQIPGGYFTGRYINNAFYKVNTTKKIGPREALMDNVQYINDEIAYKRAEFGLD
jgi:ABC-type glycerol-3-phosphate transport system substrate-binding protein